MPRLKTLLKNKLKGAARVAVLAVGSPLRGDDASGLLAVEGLGKSGNLRVFYGGSAPENLTGLVKRFNPTHLIVIDSADFKARPGSVRILGLRQITGDSFSTHRLPLDMLVSYFSLELRCRVIVIGIQPKSIKFSSPVSPQVKRGAAKLRAALKEIFAELNL